MTKEPSPRPKRFRQPGHRLLFAFGVIISLAVWGMYFHDGYHHRSVARSLESRGNTVTHTHRKTISLPKRPGVNGGGKVWRLAGLEWR